jgi:hypothetical protein
VNYRIFRKVEQQIKKNERIHQDLASRKTEEARERYLKYHPLEKISREDKAIHRSMEKLLSRQSLFYLEVSEKVEQFHRKTIQTDQYENRASFSRELFRECTKVFYDFVKEFQVTEKPNRAKVAELIDFHNLRMGAKLPKREMLKFYAQLENGSFDKIRRDGYYSKATFYRYVERFKKIGITPQNIIPEGLEVPVKMDLGQYYAYLLNHNKLITKYL